MRLLPQAGANTRVAEILHALTGYHACSLADKFQPSVSASHEVVYVEPETEDEVCEILRIANARHWSVCPTGGGQTGTPCESLANEIDIILSTVRMNQVVSYVPGDLVVTVQSGVLFKDLQAVLGEHKQMLPLDPVCRPEATVGGIAAMALSGPRRALYGTLRDMTIGGRIVLPSGDVVRAGGKVVKNVAGYDLTKLFVGSCGTLGIFTELTFKLRPLPAFRETCVLTGSIQQVQRIRAQLMQSSLVPARAQVLEGPYPQGLHATDWAFAIDCDENESACLQQREQLKTWAMELGMGFRVYQNDDANALWDMYRQHLQDTDCVVRFTAAPTRLAGIAEDVRDFVAGLGEPPPHISLAATVGCGHIFLDGMPIATQRQVVERCRQSAVQSGGTAVVEQAPAGLLAVIGAQASAGPLQTLLAGIKRTIDPHNIMNPGRFVGGV